MELETLEIFIEANTEKIQAQLEPLMPYFEKVFGNIERITGQSVNKTEKKMDVGDGVNNMSKQFEQMQKMYEKNLEMMERITSSSTTNINKGLTKGFQQSRKTVGKEVDALVKDINAKMGRAKAEQEKLAFLQAQRQDASSKGDTKNVVKYDGQVARAQEMMNKYQSQAKSMADSIKQEFKTLPASLEAMSKEMQKNESVIEGQKAKVRELTALYEQQAKKISKLSSGQLTNLYEKYGSTYDPGYQKEVKQAGFKFEDTKSSKKTGAEITKYNKEIQKLISKNDALQQSYSQAEDRTKQLRSAVKGLNTELGKSSMVTGNAAMGMKKFGKGADDSKGLFSKFGGVFNRTSNNIAHGSRRMNTGIAGFNHRLGQMVKQAFVFSVIYKGLQLVSRGLGSALMSNDEFSNSLNQIKVNLLTAFYPIYTFVLPAINAMMRALASVTGQIAHFTASLFGTTYTAAKQGASGLYQNIQAMNDSGNSADKNREKVKKLQRSLMGFDEINRIGLDDKDDDKLDDQNKGVNFNTPIPAMPDWINKANSVLRDFFKPFQDSWAKHGQTVIKAWKYALGEIVGLAQSIGKSFMDVWTNGTGEQFISNILILVANLLGLVGDVAKAFKNAWDENERGTKLIQSLFDMWNAFLGLTNEIVKSFRDAWNENKLGESILGNILEIFTNLIRAVGELGKGLKNAWKENETGTSILKTILGFFDDILGVLNDASKHTKEWAKELDFTPLLKSIDKLLKPIKEISKDVFEVLGWAYDNILLPLAKLVIEDVLPVFFNLLGNALSIVGSVLKTVKPLFVWLLDKLIKPLVDFTLGAVSDWLTFLGKFGDALEDLLTIDINSFGDVVEQFKQFGKDIWEGLKEGLTSFGEGIGTFIKESMFDPIVNWFKKLFGIHSPSTIFFDFGTFLMQGLINGIKSLLSRPVDLVKKLWDDMSGAVVTKGSVIWDSSKKVWDDVSTKVKTKATEAWTNTKDKWENIKKNTGDNFETVRSWTADKWDKVKDKVTTASSNAKTNTTNAWINMKDNVSTYNETIKTNTDKAFNAVVGWATGLGGRIKGGIDSGIDKVKEGAKALATGFHEFPLKAVNAIKNGVAWVLEKVGAGKNKLGDNYPAPNYAQGTGYHPGGMALVNDGYGSNFREAYQLPNGETGLFPNKRNLMVNLPAGSSVLSGPRTASMYGNVPAYAGGVGKWFSEKWNGFKEWTGDVWDYVSNPGKLVEVGISQFADLKGALEPSLSIAQGAIGTSMSAATSFVKNAMESFFDGGDADTSTSGLMGVMSYLSNIASDVMSKFPGMVATSGYRHGDPYSHGKRQAIDIAYPSNMNGSAAYFKPANYAFEKFRDKVAYVITQGRVRDRSGMSGTGSSGQWRGWPDNDHYDHLHINGSIAQGQGGGPKAGSGVQRWRSTVAEALYRTGQYSTANIDRTLYQMQTESGGNPNAINLWDSNAMAGIPSKGLMQVIDPTFNAYAKSPYNKNIWDPLSNIMASVRYSIARYGSLANAYRGVGYAQGTPYLPEDQIAMIHKGEMIVPADFNPYNNMADYQTLQMPELFREEAKPVNYAYTSDNKDVGGGMNGATEGIVNAVMMALNMRDTTPQQGGDTKIVVQMPDGKVLLDVVADEHNKFTDRQNYSPFKI
ncbi:transglycosylase SLT domain-containing protein [Vagococcus fluvialis]|uniref:transglycosylase SLT domain-containing protein n=1 Tax=Vagococcus fluvialis TaxID=2738 RepID=UPI0028908B34|nr:transglycosylase SLT domain-containing protein [Vagococcus fluvialis]MDT2782896.1 transglycosylase SLT domain-containing protein [Vagococcus fluvialis]